MDARPTIKFYSLLPISLVGGGSTETVDLASTAPARDMGSSHLTYLAKISSRFWNKVNIGSPDDCWEWTASKKGSTKRSSYGQFYIHGYKMVCAHRVAWMLANGDAKDGLCVLHKCNNPSCCNPSHLYLGTISDNSQDSIRAGTHAWSNLKGEKHPQRKLTECDVLEIRRLYKTGIPSQRTLAKMFLVSQHTILRIVN